MRLLVIGVIITGLAAPAALAGGLLEQLPPDGAWVRFDTVTSSTGHDSPIAGSLTMSSVGVVTVDGVKCRWLELKRVDKVDAFQTTNQADAYPTRIVKFFVPERFLAPNEKPLEHVLKYGETLMFGQRYGEEKVFWENKPDLVGCPGTRCCPAP